MKRLLFGLALGMLMAAGFAGVALADNGPHGSFTATTDACASCHRVHTAQVGNNSLLKVDAEAVCTSCHNGTGAGTDVEHGVYVQASANGAAEGIDGKSLFGGGFDQALMATAWNGKTDGSGTPATSKTTTSAHDIGVDGTVWGSGAVSTTGDKGGSMVIECTSCHDPHGNAGWKVDTTANTATKTASYRLLRWQPQGSGGFTAPAESVNWSGGAFPSNLQGNSAQAGWLVPDNFATLGTEWYTIGTSSAFAPGDYSAGNANNVYNLKNATATEATTYIPAAVNTAYFCAQCHDRYFNNSRLRNAGDVSLYCGAPEAGWTANGVALPVKADVDGVAPWIHPDDPVRCKSGPIPTGSSAPVTPNPNIGFAWGDDGSSGDSTYAYRHSSGDIRVSMDGTAAAGGGTSVSRSCMACHVSHGSTAASTALASGSTLAGDSALLRMDNRSVCLRCHAGDLGFVAP